MARQGNKERILEAARAVVQRDGLTGLKFDAVAEEAQITRAGVIYHFPSRRDLVVEVHKYVASLFNESVIDALEVPEDEATDVDRLTAYIHACANVSSRAELIFMLDGDAEQSTDEYWQAINRRWLPEASALDAGGKELRMFLVRLAADGLWMYEAATGESLNNDQRQTVARELVKLITPAQ